MGWTVYHAMEYKKNGAVDRKAELDIHYGWAGTYKVIKSAMVGSTYYAAVKDKETGQVFAVIFLTSSSEKDYDNFGYKDMDETACPGEAQCPVSILKLLTETDNKDALEWREKCWMYHTNKKSPNSLENLPLGTKIIWTIPHEHFVGWQKGQRIELIKTKLGKRTTSWVNWDSRVRINTKGLDIKDIEIVKQ